MRSRFCESIFEEPGDSYYRGNMEDEQENETLAQNKRVTLSPPRWTSPTRPVLGEIQCTATNLKTPTKPCDPSNNVDPWTPTANLKMLISAASPDIRNREREMLEEQDSGDEKTLPSRKEKSLGLLCHKFLARYPNYPNPAVNNSICLDEVAGVLNVERRRIYDIVNVLESLHMVSRLAKNKYLWHGRLNLNKTFEALRRVAEENKYGEQILLLKKKEQEAFDNQDDLKTESPITRSFAKPADISFVELPGVEFRAASVNSRKEKSLRVMSQRFVMLFLVSSPQIVSLDVAAKILIGEDQLEDLDKSKFKTKIRRLYDIANVLSSLSLIKKVHVTEERGRKPAFQWTGPQSSADGQEIEGVVDSSPPVISRPPKEHCAKNLFSPRGKPNFTRHPSLIKLAKSIENDRRKINSAPASPVKTGDVNQNSAPNSSKMALLAAICKQQINKSKDPSNMKCKVTRSAKVVLKPAARSLAADGHHGLCAHKTFLEDGTEAVTVSPMKGVQEKCSKRLLDDENGCQAKRINCPTRCHSPETLYPSGYLIPVQLATLGTETGRDSAASSPEHTAFTSPLAGVIPLKFLFSPGPVTALPFRSQSSKSLSARPCTSSQSAGSAAYNLTLQSRDMISPGSPRSLTLSPNIWKPSEDQSTSVLNMNHLSPVPFTVFALPQGGIQLTPKGSRTLQESFFQTPGGLMSSPKNLSGPERTPSGTIFISQRKLDVGSED
ncbi:transcription factor E2F8 [Pelodytes ibericus]